MGEQDGLCKWQRVITRYGRGGGETKQIEHKSKWNGDRTLFFCNILEGLDEEVAWLSANQSQEASYSGIIFWRLDFPINDIDRRFHNGTTISAVKLPLLRYIILAMQ